LDITKFYPSIDHNILKSIISRKIKDTKVLEILYEIIDSVNGINGIYGKGVPIGNYLSQYFANLYLTGFDHWCKEELKCRYYYRYADDIVILGESKAHLRNVLVAIKLYLKWEELEGSIPQDEMDTEANAITISAYGASLVAVNSRRGSSIVHEAEHIKNHIWQYIGYTPQRDNDEVDAYLLTYIYDKITQVFYKHKDNKE
jgi:hypothetical protein